MTGSADLGDVVAGRYRLDATLGHGGFGRVFEAIDLTTSARVALKMLEFDAGEQYDVAARTRYNREIAILEQLRNEHTVRLLDHGAADDGRLFLVFELLGGEDLDSIIQRHAPLPQAMVIDVLRQILESLDEAHRLGLLHRDLKPANIRVTGHESGGAVVKLMDFGIARAADGSLPVATRAGELVGTPRYMSPEQLTDQELTASSDIYSLGMVAFEMLAGASALPGNRLADQLGRLRTGHLFAAPPGGEAPALQAIIARMTERRPEARYGSARAVLHDLDPATERPQARATSKAIPAIAVLAVATVLGAAWFIQRGQPEQKLPPPGHRTVALVAVEAVDTGPAEAPGEDSGQHDATGRDVFEPAGDTPTTAPGCGFEPQFRGPGVIRIGSPTPPTSWPAYIPESYDARTPAPLIVLVHDRGTSPEEFLERSGFTQIAEQHGAILVAPLDHEPLLGGVWDEPDDLEVLAVVLEETRGLHCIDPDRVFAVGHGEGAFPLLQVMCEKWFDAMAISSNRGLWIREGCSDVIPTIWFDPRDSTLLPFAGGQSCRPRRTLKEAHDQRVRSFVDMHKCGQRTKVQLERPDGICEVRRCEVPLELCTVSGGAGWPGVPFPGLACDRVGPTFPFAEQSWRFFERVTRK